MKLKELAILYESGNFPFSSDADILKSILSLSSLKNPFELSEKLIDIFGNLKNVLEARPEALKKSWTL